MTCAGEVEIETVYGQDPDTGQWVCPMRELWGLRARQEMSPVLEKRLCYTATVTGSYEAAAAEARNWGVEADDSTIHRHVGQAGERADRLRDNRVERALSTDTRAEVVKEAKRDLPPGKISLVIMMDGTMLRERGQQWGLKGAEIGGERVVWHELKTAIIFRLDQRAETASGRGMVVEKYYEAWQGDPYEFGRRVYAEALRRGLMQAERVYVVADGAVWIWNLVADRFSDATGVLDFYHASEHLWQIARELYGQDEEKARAWVEPLLHQLAHGGEAGVLDTLDDLLALCAQLDEQAKQIIKGEVQYFQAHRDHLHYQAVQAQGCPKGSGAVESACGQLQHRFKRTGQFWSPPGQRALLALDLARRNHDWDEIWELN